MQLISSLYVGGLDKAILRPFIKRDWRFGHYEMEGLQDPLSRFSRMLLRPISLRKKSKDHADLEELVLEPLAQSECLIVDTCISQDSSKVISYIDIQRLFFSIVSFKRAALDSSLLGDADLMEVFKEVKFLNGRNLQCWGGFCSQ